MGPRIQDSHGFLYMRLNSPITKVLNAWIKVRLYIELDKKMAHGESLYLSHVRVTSLFYDSLHGEKKLQMPGE